MVNHDVLKKELEEMVLISTDFLTSNLAKELVLKDDEKTPKKINENIAKELEEILDIKHKHLVDLDVESLPSEIFTNEFKSDVMKAKSDIGELKNNVISNLNFSVFDTIKIVNEGKSYVLYYDVNKKYDGEVFIVFILATQIDNPKNRIMFGDLRSDTPLPKMFPMDNLKTTVTYYFTAVTNRGEQFNLK